MHFSKIYLQDNFVPNIVEDQFRRKVIGVEVCFSEDEKIENAIISGEQFISEYIKANTVYPEHGHIEVRNVDPENLPVIQVDRGQTLEEQINSCTDIKVLEIYKSIPALKKDPVLQLAYDKRMYILTH